MKKEKTSHNKNMRKNILKNDRGVVLLIAVTISSLVLVIGIGIISIITKEIVLSSLNKNSQAAFFAADSGIDCAMHWDLVNLIAEKRSVDPTMYPWSVFATSTESVTDLNNGFIYETDPITDTKFDPFCAGQGATYIFNTYPQTFFHMTVGNRAGWDAVDSIATTTFAFFPEKPADLNNPDKEKPCALVTISKQLILNPPSPPRTRTEIYSEGFSTCDSNDVRRVSRGVKVEYDI
jgi:hypothetical protein